MQERTKNILVMAALILALVVTYSISKAVFVKNMERTSAAESQRVVILEKRIADLEAQLDERGDVADTLKTAWVQCTKNYSDLNALYLEDDRRHVVTVEWYRGHATDFLSNADFAFSNGLYEEWMTKQRASDVKYRETRETMDKDTKEAAEAINEVVN